MKTLLKQLASNLYFVALIFSISLLSCKKETPEPETLVVPVTPTPANASFTWQEDGGSVITADSAYWTTGTWGTGIRAFKGNDFFEINWNAANDVSVGTKVLTTSYGFTFLKGSATYTCGTNENLAITGSASSLITGNTTVSVAGGTIASLAITFASLPQH